MAIDLRQATKEFANPVSWVRLVIGVLLIFGIYKYVTRPTQTIKDVKGNVNIYNAPKRLFIPFVEGGVEKNSAKDLDTYIRAGVRVEF